MYLGSGRDWSGIHRRIRARWPRLLAALTGLYVFIALNIFWRNDVTLGHALLVALAIEAIFVAAVVVVVAFFVALTAVTKPEP